MSTVKPIPDGFRTLTPHLIIKDCAKAIDFYKKAFGAEEIMRMPVPGGQGVMHCELKIGDSILMACDEIPGMCKSPKTLGGTAIKLHLYVPNVDAAFKRAVDAGCETVMPPADMFWGDRYGSVKDPFGHEWSIATHIKDVTPEECAKGAQEFFAHCKQ